MGEPYVYVIVRADLSCPQRLVHAGHALWELSKACGPAGTASLVVCGAADEAALEGELARLTAAGHPAVGFREPDQGGSLTAVASMASSAEQRKLFRRCTLLV